MRKGPLLFAIIITLLSHHRSFSQTPDTLQHPWTFSASASGYFIPADFFVLPVVTADHRRMHLEARYNYEDRNTVSLFGGYKFEGGNQFTYSFIPMVGGVTGRSDGIAPALEMELDYRKFSFYSESEYLFEFSAQENHFFYVWSEIGYSPLRNFTCGMSIQKTKSYHSDFNVQRGLFLSYQAKFLEWKGYVFNPFSGDSFAILTMSVEF